MKKSLMNLAMAAFVAMLAAATGAADGDQPTPENVPELMRTFAGVDVKTREEWEKVRAPELLKRFQKDVYGCRPAVADDRSRVSFKVYDERPVMDGRAVRKLVRAEFDGPLGKFSFPFNAYIPKAKSPVPAFVSICLQFRSKVGADNVITSECWPVEQIVGRGYATAGFLTDDVATEKNTGFAQGVFKCVEPAEARNDESWGTISAWAWAASRVMDWIETEPAIDAARVGIVGHSRGGKTALWAGATDRRFALVCSNDSGAHGAKLNHIRLPKSEDIASIPKYFPNWYCGNYPKKHGGREMTMDFDQHELLALERLGCCASALPPKITGRGSVESGGARSSRHPPGNFTAGRVSWRSRFPPRAKSSRKAVSRTTCVQASTSWPHTTGTATWTSPNSTGGRVSSLGGLLLIDNLAHELAL